MQPSVLLQVLRRHTPGANDVAKRKFPWVMCLYNLKIVEAISSLANALLLLFSLRFISAAIVDAEPSVWPNAVLVLGGIMVAYICGRASWFAFISVLFCASGLNQSGLLTGCRAPLTLLFSAIYIGSKIRSVARSLSRNGQPDGKDEHDLAYTPLAFTADLLLICIFISLARTLWAHRASPGLYRALWARAEFGFGDEYYFLTASLIWVQGLYLFRELCTMKTRLNQWVNPVFTILILILGCFYLFQFTTHVPEPLWDFACFLPCEDISSFGSISVVALAFTTASYQRGSRLTTFHFFCFEILLAGLIIGSWSRASWLSAVLMVLATCAIRLSWKWILFSLLCVIWVIISVNLNIRSNPGNDDWHSHPYSSRLASLVRFENLSAKDPTRIELYNKAIGMIAKRPILGHGIGSFYLTSTKFGREGDYYRYIPDFAHNALLQIAAELGIPAALGIAWLAGSAIYRVILSLRKNNSSKIAIGLATALVCYLLTQMTANSLNVYASNQFIFWFLLAAIYNATGLLV